jgi:hypothetical protein
MLFKTGYMHPRHGMSLWQLAIDRAAAWARMPFGLECTISMFT